MEIKDKQQVLIKKMKLDGNEVKLELKGIPVQIKVIDDEQGIIEAYISVFDNVDSYGDVVVKGAFKDAIKNNFPRYPKGVWAHDWSLPIAKTLEIREDDRGLYVKGQLLLDIQKGKEAYILIKEGVMTDFSFGYEVDEADFDSNKGIRYLKKLTIYEWSPVLVGANSRATLLGVKSDGQVIEEQPSEPEQPAPVQPVPKEEMEPNPVGPGKIEEPKEPIEPEVKAGRVLSEKNRDLIQRAVDDMNVLKESMDNLIQMFEALLQATEQPSSTNEEGKTAVEQRVKSSMVTSILLRDARQVVKAGNRLILRAKQMDVNH